MGEDGTPGRLVRPFTLTGGRTRPTHGEFTLITTVTAVVPWLAGAARTPQEFGRILRQCAEPVAVVELAARLDLPVSVVVVLLGDLLEAGRITARPPHAVTRANPSLELLQKVRKGLDRL
ncbi:DUF742 domain-containing protein [Streptomyces gramineus]|uniref:DUF742 domain-containing protein n=1 Tax=Streptomyces gramineus TaxID=910542 RepID=UPI00398A794D